MTDQHRDALRNMGMSDEQIDAALATMTGGGAHAADPSVATPSSTPTTAESPATDPSRPCHMTAGDLFMSLNGFDEIAVAQRFGAPIGELRSDAVTLGRALAFVHMRRTGLNDQDAYKASMDLTIHTVSHAYFQPEPEKPSAEGNEPGGYV